MGENMARLEKMPEAQVKRLLDLPCPTFDRTAWTKPRPLRDCRVSLISTAGLSRRGDAPFTGFSGEYRVIPGDTPASDVVMSHISTNFDRTGFMQDLNLVLPMERLNELAQQGVIASVGGFHYSFMGATDPTLMEAGAREVAGLLNNDQVDLVILVPV
jgi:D-proline reductase (dithiol) PrdB